MKKIFLASLVTSLVVFGTSCLKDKEYEDQEYGIQGVEIKGVGIVQSVAGLSYGLVSQTASQTINGPVIALFADDKATEDIHVTLTLNPTIVADNDLVLLPTSAYAINTDVVIPAGQKSVVVPITFPDASTLDATQPYGLGFTISSVASGYTIATNMKDVVIAFNIKNRFDGEYSLKMQHLGWLAYGIWDGPSLTYPDNFGIVTAGANSFTLENYARGDENLQPGFTTTPAATGFGAAAPIFTFDADNKLINVDNLLPDDGRGRDFTINGAVTTSRFDPTDRTIYAAYIMSQTGRPPFYIYDTFTYIGPR